MAHCDEYDHAGFYAVVEQYEDSFFVFHDKGADNMYSTISPLCAYRLKQLTDRHEKMPIPRMISEDGEIEFIYYGVKKGK